MAKYQRRISISPEIDQITKEMADHYRVSQTEILTRIFDRGYSSVLKEYVSDRRNLQALKKEAGQPQYRSIKQAVLRNWDALTQSRIHPDRLVKIREGDRPTELELARIAIAAGVTEDYLEELPLNHNGDIPNGSEIR